MADTRMDSGAAELPTLEDTISLGIRLGEELRAGDVVVLSGPLGRERPLWPRGLRSVWTSTAR